MTNLDRRIRSAAAGLAAGLAAGFLAAGPLAAQEAAPCLVCHGTASNFAGTPDSASLVVTEATFAASVHGQAGMPCTSCHAGLSFPHPEDPPVAKCSACHPGVAAQYEESLHGHALATGDTLAPTCTDCHGVHDIRHSSDPEARTSHENAADLCAECHGPSGVELRRPGGLPIPQVFTAYARSIHGQSLREGAATCTDCHGVHDMKGPANPESMTNRANIAETCGTCHGDIREEFEASIHGRAVRAGLRDSPTCSDCHGEHLILPHDAADARTSGARQALALCADCHNDPAIIEKYGLQQGVVGSYADSYHGWATRLEHGHVASCVSCHTAHAVLPASDSASTVHESNVVATCRNCHPDASEAFAESYNHVSASIAANPVNRVLRAIYLWLIVIVIGGMFVHNAIIMGWYLRDARRRHVTEPGLQRLSRGFVLQHVGLILSFFLLVVTGFALRYPDAWWVRGLAAAGLDEVLRGTIHRVAGVILIIGSIWHVIWLALFRTGRRFLRDMAPGPGDVSELTTNVGFHLGLTRRHARFARFGYAEKAEYWALIWGTVLMAVTGLVLWFPARTVGWAPAWIVAASQTVHFYEAWLATLAILVWHFFFVIFHPDAYPLSFTWLDGRMPEEQARHHHPRWYAAEKGEAEAGDEAGSDAGAGDRTATRDAPA
ncbi:MAG: cytochrome c3 family protein [Gemmatimonadota bacterium]|nr:cytochrome c3 family protein [Gemmatimonadota bacterium]